MSCTKINSVFLLLVWCNISHVYPECHVTGMNIFSFPSSTCFSSCKTCKTEPDTQVNRNETVVVGDNLLVKLMHFCCAFYLTKLQYFHKCHVLSNCCATLCTNILPICLKQISTMSGNALQKPWSSIKGLFTNYVSQKWGVQTPLPPLSAIVSISPNPPPPFVSLCQHFPSPPPPPYVILSAFAKPPFAFLCQFCEHI